MKKPITNGRSIGAYCRLRARFRAKKEFEQLTKDIIDLSIEESPRQRKIIRKRHLYRALVKKADSLRDYVNAIKESDKETEITAETLLEDFGLCAKAMNISIEMSREEHSIYSEEDLKYWQNYFVKDFEKELIQFINQFKNKSDTPLN